jgi:NADH:ubiquinone oxidoreductase subunit 4 (subunit M)
MVGIILIITGTPYEIRMLEMRRIKLVALGTSISNLIVSLIVFIAYDLSSNQFQFVQENHDVNIFDFYLGLDGLSLYFVLLTTIIIPIALLSN